MQESGLAPLLQEGSRGGRRPTRHWRPWAWFRTNRTVQREPTSDVATHASSAFTLAEGSEVDGGRGFIKGCLFENFILGAQFALLIGSARAQFHDAVQGQAQVAGLLVGLMFACEGFGSVIVGSHCSHSLFPVIGGLVGGVLYALPGAVTNTIASEVLLFAAFILFGLSHGASHTRLHFDILRNSKSVMSARKFMYRVGVAYGLGMLAGCVVGFAITGDYARDVVGPPVPLSPAANASYAVLAASVMSFVYRLKSYSASRGTRAGRSLEQERVQSGEALVRYRCLVGDRGSYSRNVRASNRLGTATVVALVVAYVTGMRCVQTILASVLMDGAVCDGTPLRAINCRYSLQQVFAVWGYASACQVLGMLISAHCIKRFSLLKVAAICLLFTGVGLSLLIDWGERVTVVQLAVGIGLWGLFSPILGGAIVAFNAQRGGSTSAVFNLSSLLSTSTPFWVAYLWSVAQTRRDQLGPTSVMFGVCVLVTLPALLLLACAYANPVASGKRKHPSVWNPHVPEVEDFECLPLSERCGVPLVPLATNTLLALLREDEI